MIVDGFPLFCFHISPAAFTVSPYWAAKPFNISCRSVNPAVTETNLDNLEELYQVYSPVHASHLTYMSLTNCIQCGSVSSDSKEVVLVLDITRAR